MIVKLTGDPRRFPDCGDGGNGIYDYTTWLDEDLRSTVIRACVGVPASEEALWAFINVFDAAIDEQDRRRGVEPRPTVRTR